MGKEEKEVLFFVLGTESGSKGYFMARVIRTQLGVHSAVFNCHSHTLKVKYEPELISIEAMKDLTYFNGCYFVSEKEEVDKCVRLLLRQQRLEKALLYEGILLVLILVYIIIGEIMLIPVSYAEYSCLITIILILGVTTYIHRKVKNTRRENCCGE